MFFCDVLACMKKKLVYHYKIAVLKRYENDLGL